MQNPFNQQRAYLSLSVLIILGLIVVTSCTPAIAQQNVSVTDHYKYVVMKHPRQVEVCENKRVSGDKTGDALMGAIIGGIIGNNVTKDLPDGGTAGAIIGGMLGHNNSTAKSGTKTVCQVETRYTEQKREMYSHSTVTFTHDGKTYTLKFVR